MTAMETIWEIEDLGGSVSVQGGAVRWSAPAPLQDGLVDALRRYEEKVLSIISAPRSEFSDWQALFGECLELTLEREAATRADKAEALTRAFLGECLRLALEGNAAIREAKTRAWARLGKCIEHTLENHATISVDEAESLALEWCITVWEIRNPAPSSPDRCMWCDESDDTFLGTVLPFCTGSTGYTWLHHKCWQSWSKRREAEATDALAQMGVVARKRTEADATLGKILDMAMSK